LGHPCKFQLVSRLGSVTARHSSSGRQPNCGVEQRAPPMFGRATITLGILVFQLFGHLLRPRVVQCATCPCSPRVGNPRVGVSASCPATTTTVAMHVVRHVAARVSHAHLPNVPIQLRKCLSIDRSRSLQPARLRRRQSCTRFMDGRSAVWQGTREETGGVEMGLFDSRGRGLTYRTRSVATTAVAIDRNRDG